MNPTAITAIQAMVAPVVLITTAAILSGGLVTMYGSVNDRMPMLLRRHRLLHDAVLLIYAGLAVLVLSVIAIAVAVTNRSGPVGTTALVLVLAGTVTLLGGLLFAARSIMISTDAIDYGVSRALSIGS